MKALYKYLFRKPKLLVGDKIAGYYNYSILDIQFDWVFGDWMILVQSEDKLNKHYMSRHLYNFYIG
jgi:hypothetical protein